MTRSIVSVVLVNETGGEAHLVLSHAAGADHAVADRARGWSVGRGETTDALEIEFDPAAGLVADLWSVSAFVKNGPNAGLHVNRGVGPSHWFEHRLEEGDAGTSVTFVVGAGFLETRLSSGSRRDPLVRIAKAPPASGPAISRVFVVMLENHSFDNMLAMSGLPDLTVATTADYNIYPGFSGPSKARVRSGAKPSMTTDPGHEFMDVVDQLCGLDATYRNGKAYPPIDNSGFAASYATSTSEWPYKRPPLARVPDIMACFDTRSSLPVLYALAKNFAVCDQWFSSMPGPTWPNRFFLHAASSCGFDHSPSSEQMGEWETIEGLSFPNGTIFDSLAANDVPFRLYNDYVDSWDPKYRDGSIYSDDPAAGSAAGAVPQAGAIYGLAMEDFYSLEGFASDLQGSYPYPYTFIEPHYGAVSPGSYKGGSSQHPMDDTYGGEALLRAVYEGIRRSPHWDSSLLVILYDEHGGFYDSVPPGTAAAPGDDTPPANTTYGFDFTQLGVRVPAVLVSPLIPAGRVDHDGYDHSSVPRMLAELHGMATLTDRDAGASWPSACLSLTTPRTDDVVVPEPAPATKRRAGASANANAAADRARALEAPMPESGSLVGALFILRKTDFEMSDRSEAARARIEARVASIRTRGDAERYALEVRGRLYERRRAAGTVHGRRERVPEPVA